MGGGGLESVASRNPWPLTPWPLTPRLLNPRPPRFWGGQVGCPQLQAQCRPEGGPQLEPSAGPAVSSTLLPGVLPQEGAEVCWPPGCCEGHPGPLPAARPGEGLCTLSGCLDRGTPATALRFRGETWRGVRGESGSPALGVHLLLPDHAAAPGPGPLLRRGHW